MVGRVFYILTYISKSSTTAIKTQQQQSLLRNEDVISTFIRDFSNSKSSFRSSEFAFPFSSIDNLNSFSFFAGPKALSSTTRRRLSWTSQAIPSHNRWTNRPTWCPAPREALRNLIHQQVRTSRSSSGCGRLAANAEESSCVTYCENQLLLDDDMAFEICQRTRSNSRRIGCLDGQESAPSAVYDSHRREAFFLVCKPSEREGCHVLQELRSENACCR